VPMPVEEQVVAIFAGNEGFLDDIPTSTVLRFREELLQHMRASQGDLLKTITDEKKLSDEIREQLKSAIDSFKQMFSADE